MTFYIILLAGIGGGGFLLYQHFSSSGAPARKHASVVKGVIDPDFVIRRQERTRANPWSRKKVRMVGLLYVIAMPSLLLWDKKIFWVEIDSK